MNIRIFIIMLLFQEMLSSCVDLHKSEYNKIVNQWVGKNIKLPLINKNEYIGKYKIITRINGSCYSCIYQLKDWKLFIDEVKEKYSIPFLLYLVTNDTATFNSINKREIHFDYPLIYDKNNMLFTCNRFPQNSIYHTMLLDNENSVIIIGNPINNATLKNLYIKKLKNYKNNTNK